METISYTEA